MAFDAGPFGIVMSWPSVMTVAAMVAVVAMVAIDVRVTRNGVHAGSMNDVVMPMRVKEVMAVAKPEGQGHEAHNGHRGVIDPIIGRRHRSPADVVVTGFAYTPHHPSGSIGTTGHPAPTTSGDPHPSTIVEGDISPIKVADPDPVALVGDTPTAIAAIRSEVFAHDDPVGDPHRAVLTVSHPLPVRLERLAEIAESGNIRVGLVIVIVAGIRCGQFRCAVIRQGCISWLDPCVDRRVSRRLFSGSVLREQDEHQRHQGDQPCCRAGKTMPPMGTHSRHLHAHHHGSS